MFDFKDSMSADEMFALVASLAIGLIGAFRWYSPVLRLSKLGAGRSLVVLLLAPPLALACLWGVLVTSAAVEVRTDVRYQVLFVVMGAVWVFHLPRSLVFIGVSYRDDALERRNTSAAIAIAGTIAGLAIVFAGSNMGEGPSIWNTVATALASTAALAAIVFGFGFGTSLGDSIAVERDTPTGVRFAGLVAGCGILLARASAGDWVSTAAMLNDLVAFGLPAGALSLTAMVIERALRPRESCPRPSLFAAGVMPAAAYVASSIAYVASLPSWRDYQ